MGLRDWLQELKRLHERRRGGLLVGAELRQYEESCAELVGVIVATQRLGLKRGQVPRERLRVQLKLEVELVIRGWKLLASTLDLSSGGFAALVSYQPSAGEQAEATLLLPGGKRVGVRASIASVTRSGSAFRASFIFESLAPEARTLLELLILDVVLADLGL